MRFALPTTICTSSGAPPATCLTAHSPRLRFILRSPAGFLNEEALPVLNPAQAYKFIDHSVACSKARQLTECGHPVLNVLPIYC